MNTIYKPLKLNAMKGKVTREELEKQALQLEIKIAKCVNEKDREILETELYQCQYLLLKMNKSFLNEIENEPIN
ncbi:hypothetical protein [Capnocytophaga canimorsus]|uniref:hypothetical protein n=2 Tax=Flavobacteriaceae TaxID=49546 RepID=UPI00208A9134|nr:hypothetical protein CAPN009_16770 [Capnocytophaga canimorsus]